MDPVVNSKTKTLKTITLRDICPNNTSTYKQLQAILETKVSLVSDGRKLSKELMEELKKNVWKRNFYVDLDPSLEKSGYVEK